MTVLISADELTDRRSVAAGPLRPLAESLRAELVPVIDRPLYVPEQKALLSREGGRCPRDGTMLGFDPFEPHMHRCPVCGETCRGELHDRFWIYWYQLWLAERCVHGAMLAALDVEPRGRAFAESILGAYVDLYPRYPNVDNALGPTRPFFSTYLESIWLLQLCAALDLLERGQTSALGQRVRETIIEPSAALIASYDEGMSNRQVWNNAALMAASCVLGRPNEIDRIVWSESGLVMHLSEALLADGTWYEGENYHLFAHRGLWYGVSMAQRHDAELPPALVDRFRAGFAAPFLTALPDFTLPSRRDSQYAISLRQWRFAEMCELGLAETDDPTLLASAAALYDPSIPHGATGRSTSSAEAERNAPASGLTRADLGWRSLLFARPELPPTSTALLPSVLLDAQGIGVMRRDRATVYVALDYGQSGGGHGHPDRLNLLLVRDRTRWLDDMGTGSYVDPSLHWYRSTLAHNAPMVNGRSQRRVSGVLEAYDDRGGAGWISASADVAAGSTVRRTVVALTDYMVDELMWTIPARSFIDLPLHIDASSGLAPLRDAPIHGSDGLEDGFRFVHGSALAATVDAGQTIRLGAASGDSHLDLWIGGDCPIEIWRLIGPGAPGKSESPFLVLRMRASQGTIRSAWSWAGKVQSAELTPTISIESEGARHGHARGAHGWNVVIHVGDARSTIDLGGVIQQEQSDEMSGVAPEAQERRAVVLRPDHLVRLTLGEESYRRSEESWEEAGRPTAEVSLANDAGRLRIDVAATNVDRSFAEAGAANRLDNENADINGAGVQLYLRTDDASAAYVLVPRDGGEVGVRAIDGWGASIPVKATWTPVEGGYVVSISTEAFDSAAGTVIEVDVVVNEKPRGRERRRGQLVLSGVGGSDYIYLRGDRHDPHSLIPMLLTDV